MPGLPLAAPQTGWQAWTRLAREPCVRLGSSDHSGHPAVIGRRIDATRDLARVRVLCDGQAVADHERIWTWHQLRPRRLAGNAQNAEHPVLARQDGGRQ
jgi:hypothetical protein